MSRRERESEIWINLYPQTKEKVREDEKEENLCKWGIERKTPVKQLTRIQSLIWNKFSSPFIQSCRKTGFWLLVMFFGGLKKKDRSTLKELFRLLKEQ